MALTAAVVLSLGLAGCSGDGGKRGKGSKGSADSADSAGAAGAKGFDVEKAFRGRDRAAHSAQVTFAVAADGEEVLEGKGFVNLGKQQTGEYTVVLTPPDAPDQQFKAMQRQLNDGVYIKILSAPGDPNPDYKWERAKPGDRVIGPDLNHLDLYAELLLDQGPGAREGQETNDYGDKLFHLSGRISPADLKDRDPDLYDTLRADGVKFYDTDIWLDGEGRVARYERTATGAKQAKRETFEITLTDFARPQEVMEPDLR